MKNKLNTFLISLLVLVFISIFYRWFLLPEIIGGDWPYLFKESLENYYFLVPSWNTWQGNGLGGTNPIYFLQSFEYLTVFLATFLHIPWQIIYKIFWFGLFIFLSISTSIYFVNVILRRLIFWQKLLSAIIFTTNTYVLMLVGGGQMGVALSYAIAPLVLARFIKLIDSLRVSNKNFQLALLAGLVLSFQVLFDPRIAYITMIAVAIYMAFNIKKNLLNTLFLIFYTFVIPGLIAVLLHLFWILPLFTFSQNICERFCEAYSGKGIVKFLSFSTFSQSLSLLHPNWPENIFGKTYFMKAEFILVPIVAYSSLLFKFRRRILFFALLGIVGAFLAKGANPPFGEVYLWLFENVPGFVTFRDPTKFYLLIVLAYSVLIPFGIHSACSWFNSKLKSQSSKLQLKTQNYLSVVIFLFFIIYWVILIHPAILGQLGGTFKKYEVPKEYVELKDFLYSKPEFFRTLWVPSQHRFAFVSKVHPSVEAGALFNSTSLAQIIENLKKPESEKYLSSLSIKYILVPYDNLGKIFQKDRKYDDELYKNTVKDLESIHWLKKTKGFGKIQIFELLSKKDHLSLSGDGFIFYKMSSPTNYFVTVEITYPQKLIFSEKYNPSWVAKIKEIIIKSEKTSSNLNSFALEKGDYDLEIIFLQDKVYNFGRYMFLVTFLGVFFIIFKHRKSNALSN